MVKCSRCGKEMTDEDGKSIIGVHISVGGMTSKIYEFEFLKRQLGKYEFGKPYQFCYECCLDSLMGK